MRKISAQIWLLGLSLFFVAMAITTREYSLFAAAAAYNAAMFVIEIKK